MNFFKRIDNYLLHHYPSVWITRVHVFLPIGLAIVLLLAGTNIALGWDPRDTFPRGEVPVILMIIPVLIYLIYWFIFQSRYNVAKSGGKMPMAFEYLNFFLYLLVFSVAFLIIIAIPLSNHQKVIMSVNKNELLEDIRVLNEGNTLVNNTGAVRFLENGTIEFEKTRYLHVHVDNETYHDERPRDDFRVVTEKEALQIISDFITAHNKYSEQYIPTSPEQILQDRRSQFYGEAVADYNYWSPDGSLYYIADCGIANNCNSVFYEPWFWKISMLFIAFFSLLVWIFKQMKLRQFVFGFIAICLTPLVMAIVAVILFELIGIDDNEGSAFSFFVLLVYIAAIFFSLKGYSSDRLENMGYISTMYLQFFLPLFPLFLFLAFADDHGYYGNEDNLFNILYWSGWVIGVLSILLFKPLYAKFGALPAKN